MALDQKYRFQNAEVVYSEAEIVTAQRSDIAELVTLSSKNQRARIRLCAHRDPAQPLHEMLIVHERSAYVRPHKHPAKTESMHIISGAVDFVAFDDAGQIAKLIRMGDYASGLPFYSRVDTPIFHTLIIRSDVLVFHETTDGPFQPGASIFPAWAPDGADPDAARRYIDDVNQRIKFF
jgi:cupin fold WbuC family metalloprotein